MMAVRKDNVDAVTLLLHRLADVSVTDSKDKTCLYVASEENCVNVFAVSVTTYSVCFLLCLSILYLQLGTYNITSTNK